MPAILDEIRAAVAFYGGVSLAVYEGGVAHELYRAVRGEGVYATALGSGRRFVVDVIAGTSAGGITGGILAHALASGADFTALRRVWIDRGDLTSFAFPSTGPVPSLLDGERLRAIIADVLPIDRAAPLVDDLVAYLTVTDLAGQPVWFTDSLGHKILATKNRDYRTFTHDQLRRGADESPEAYRARLARLVSAMRATSSFPGAFAPQLDDGRWLMDGGVLDNKPIGQALRGIMDRRAYVLEHRKLFFVEPDPTSTIKAPDPTRTPHPLETVAGVLGIALDDSIFADLRAIDDVNMRYEWYAKFREIVNGFVALLQSRGVHVLDDPALRQPLDDLAQQIRFAQVFLDGASDRWSRWRRLVPRLLAAGVDPFTMLRDLVEDGAAGVDMHLRWYRWIIHDMMAMQLGPARLDAEGALPDRVRRLLQPAEGEEVRGLKQWLFEEILDPVQAAWARAGIAEAVQQWIDDPPDDVAAGAARLMQEVRARRDRARLVQVIAGRDQALGERAARDPVLGPLYVAFDVFAGYETLSLVVEGLGDLVNKQQIDLVRISPRDADNLSLIGATPAPDEAARVKLAGEILGHFGGFLDRNWRRNDYIWGRLDAAEIILSVIASTGAPMQRSRLQALITDVRREILREEHEAYARELGQTGPVSIPDPIAHPPMNRPLIGRGRESVEDLPPIRRAYLFGYFMQTIPRMLQTPASMPGMAGLMRGLGALGMVLRTVTEPLLLVTAPSEERWNRAIWRLAQWSVIGLAAALAIGYAAGSIGLIAALTWLAITLVLVGFVFVMGAVAGTPRWGWLLAGILAVGLVVGVLARPALERAWMWLVTR